MVDPEVLLADTLLPASQHEIDVFAVSPEDPPERWVEGVVVYSQCGHKGGALDERRTVAATRVEARRLGNVALRHEEFGIAGVFQRDSGFIVDGADLEYDK